MLVLGWQSLLSKLLVSVLCSATADENFKHASSTAAVYSPLGKYLNTIEKLVPFANSKLCASMRGLEDLILTPPGCYVVRGCVTELKDVVAVVVVVVAEDLLVPDTMLEVLVFEQQS